MCCGLQFLREVITAKTYEDRYRLLDSKYGFTASEFTSTTRRFLNPEDDGVPLEHCDRELLDATLGTPFMEDSDPGPAQAWKWTHLKLTRASFLGGLCLRDLRRRGYVMWDHSRLVRFGFFGSLGWQHPADPEVHEASEAMEKSWARRRWLHIRGLRGWWSEGDESKLTGRYRELSPTEEIAMRNSL